MHQKIFIFAACLVFAAVASGCVKHRSSPRAPIINVGSEANAFSLFDIGITNPEAGSRHEIEFDLGNPNEFIIRVFPVLDSASMLTAVAPPGMIVADRGFAPGTIKMRVLRERRGRRSASAWASFQINWMNSPILWPSGIVSEFAAFGMESLSLQGSGSLELLQAAARPLPVLNDVRIGSTHSIQQLIGFEGAVAAAKVSFMEFGSLNGVTARFDRRSLEATDRLFMTLHEALAMVFGSHVPDPISFGSFYSALASDFPEFAKRYSMMIAGVNAILLGIVSRMVAGESEPPQVTDSTAGAFVWLALAGTAMSSNFFLAISPSQSVHGAMGFREVRPTAEAMNSQAEFFARAQFEWEPMKFLYGPTLFKAGEVFLAGLRGNSFLLNELALAFNRGELPVFGLPSSGFDIIMNIEFTGGEYTISGETNPPVGSAPIRLVVIRSDGYVQTSDSVTNVSGGVTFQPITAGSQGALDAVHILHRGGDAKSSLAVVF